MEKFENLKRFSFILRSMLNKGVISIKVLSSKTACSTIEMCSKQAI